MPRRALSRGGARAVTSDGGTVRAQVDARHRCRRRPGGSPGVSLHLLRDAVPPTVLQLR